MDLALFGGRPIRQRPFSPWPVYGEEEEKSLLEVLRSCSWGGYSEKVKEFEANFARLQGVQHAIACVNGTVALEAALAAVGIQCGDEVIVPPITFISTATAVLSRHGVPVFADIDPNTLNLSPEAVEQAVSPRTRAMIPVHFGGHPADVDGLGAIAKEHGLAIVEDAAHAHGASWRGIPVGNFGVAATFSFQAFKLATAGEGGAIVTNSDSVAEKIWGFCNLGRRHGGGWYEHFTLGTNYRLTGFQAGVLSAQLKKLPQQNCVRAENARYFRERMRTFNGLTLGQDDPRVTNHTHYLVTLRYDPAAFAGAPREVFLRALQAEGIPAQPTYPYPLYRNPLFQSLSPCGCGKWSAPQDYRSLFLPESERICKDGIWLEHYMFLGTHQDVDDVIAAFEKVQRQAGSLLQLQESSPGSRL
ncbi:MAG: DegT/DnrJ/EryC1/StrS family aminotransferase [Terriglobia bacterium]